jgi:hypothetical protein
MPHDPLCNCRDHDHDADYRRSFNLTTRRDFLRLGALTIGGIAMAPFLRAAPQPNARAKAVIQVFLSGGPSHLDTFDPKPNAPGDFTGPWRKAIGTNVTGIQINELLPRIAKQADKFTILRGMTHNSNSHETGQYMMRTGTSRDTGAVYPSTGAVIAYKMEEAGLLEGHALPPYISVPSSIGRFSESGFLGARYRSFVPGSLGNPIKEADRRELEKRGKLLSALDSLGHTEKELFEEADHYNDLAKEMVLGKARNVFDISKEKEATRKLYGNTAAGRACLQARRLIENGVAYVTVHVPGWDTHRNQAQRYKSLMPELDQSFAALIADLAQRGLLETTIVTCGGEFGRTPRFQTEPPFFGGRNHYCNAFSWIVAGGGFRGGQLLGETDVRGEKVIKRPIAPWDLSASIYQLVGVDPDGKLPRPTGAPVPVVPLPPAAKHGAAAHSAARVAGGTSDAPLASGGILKEIMNT